MKGAFMFRIFIALALICALSPNGFSQKRNAWIFGAWDGTGYQTDTDSTWAMRFSIKGNKYLIEYPSLKCGGEWMLISINAHEARFRERIKYGMAECTNNGLVVIRRLSNRQILFLYSNERSREITASAVLNRRSK
jgi:hypothetical protein